MLRRAIPRSWTPALRLRRLWDSRNGAQHAPFDRYVITLLHSHFSLRDESAVLAGASHVGTATDLNSIASYEPNEIHNRQGQFHGIARLPFQDRRGMWRVKLHVPLRYYVTANLLCLVIVLRVLRVEGSYPDTHTLTASVSTPSTFTTSSFLHSPLHSLNHNGSRRRHLTIWMVWAISFDSWSMCISHKQGLYSIILTL